MARRRRRPQRRRSRKRPRVRRQPRRPPRLRRRQRRKSRRPKRRLRFQGAPRSSRRDGPSPVSSVGGARRCERRSLGGHGNSRPSTTLIIGSVTMLGQVGTLVVATSFVQLANGFFGTFFSLRIATANFEPVVTGLVLSNFFAGFTLAAVLSGRIIERVGH